MRYGVKAVPVSLLVMVLVLSVFPVTSTAVPAGEFESDTVEEPILPDDAIGLDDPSAVTWHTPVGWSGHERLEEIVIFSEEGHAIKYFVDQKAIEGGRGLEIASQSNHTIPEGIDMMMPLTFMGEHFLALSGDKLLELDQETLDVLTEVDLGFEPKWYSNLWNRWSPMNSQGECLFVVADDRKVALFARIPPNQVHGEFNERRFYETVNLNDFKETRGAKVCGEPIVLNVPLEDNGSLIVVPTNVGIAALFLDYNISGNRVRSVGIGDMVWFMSYDTMSDDLDIEVEPTWGRTVSIALEDPNEARGKERIFLMTNSGLIHAFHRENGTLNWSLDLMGENIRDWEMVGMWATPRGDLIVTATIDGDGLVVSIDPVHGVIHFDGLAYHVMPEVVTMRPAYSPSSYDYILCTEDGTVYILNQLLILEARFEVPGGLVTDVGYVGNIVNNIGSSQGNYFAAITGNTTLWVQSTTGRYTPPPLPEPGEDRVVIVTDRGNITIALFANESPNTVSHFLAMVENGTYTDVPVEFVVPTGYIMTGDPGGVDTNVPNEGTALALPNRLGAVSMLPHGYGTTGPEFVITTVDGGQGALDGYMAVFGVVVEGLDVAQEINDLPHDQFNRPDEEVLIQEIVLLKDVEDNGDPGPEPEPDDRLLSILVSLVVGIVIIVIVIILAYVNGKRD